MYAFFLLPLHEILILYIMKKLLLGLLSILCAASSHAISLNGVKYTIDTLSMFSAGPGAMYYELRMLRESDHKGRLDAFLLQIDTRNPYVTVEQVLGKGQVVGSERPSAMAIRSTTDNKIFFGGVNGDFFVTSGDIGLPVGTTIVNNEYALTPAGAGGGRRSGGMDASGRGVTAYTHSYSMKLLTSDTTLNITHANYKRQENELVLYNIHNGATTATNAYGTELQIELLAGYEWATTGVMKAKITKKEENVGSMPLDEKHAVLSGHGAMQTELNQLQVGDEVTLDFEMRLDDEIVNVAQLIGGDHYSAMILDDGHVATSGYWNENHPRTTFGVSQTRDTVFMLVVDGRGESVGCTTKILAEIMKYYGAYNAVNWDGGGSSCMYLRPIGQMNRGSDGSERAVANGMFAVANVPETDNTIVAIAPYMPNYYLPRYGIATPMFLGYNKYGVLVDADVENVQLSCESEVGKVLEDGRFLASGENGGKLIATWGDLTTEIDVRIVKSAPITIRLDSVLCDARHPYMVEVNGVVGNNTIEVLAEALTWTSSDPAIATVNEKGEILGVKNGRVIVTGTLGDGYDTIIVNVEVAEESQLLWDDFREASTWELTCSPASYNPSLFIPENPKSPVNMMFSYSGGRVPFVQLYKDSLLYSLPEKILVPITTNAVFEKVIVMIRANNATSPTHITFLKPNSNEENVLEVDVVETFGKDAAIFPLSFIALKMIPNSATPKGECYVTLPGIIEVFEEETTSRVGSANLWQDSTNRKCLKDGNLYILLDDKVYDALGKQVNK